MLIVLVLVFHWPMFDDGTILAAQVRACLVEVYAREQQVGWNGVWGTMQDIRHFAQGDRAVSCQVVALSQQQVSLCHAGAVLQQHFQQPAVGSPQP